jgi:hypothetical protein
VAALNVVAYPDTVGSEARRAEPLFRAMYSAFDGIARNRSSEMCDLTVVIAEDLSDAVRSLTGDADFEGDRVGGSVMGKAVKMDPAWREARVFIPAWLFPEGAETSWQPMAVLLAAHELSHTLLSRMRGGEPSADFTDDHDVARSARAILQYAVDELRADLVADVVVRQLSTVNAPDGTTRPGTSVDVLGETYLPHLAEVLDNSVYPAWPDLVESYRDHQTDLNTMWKGLVQGTDQVMTAFAHAEAEAISSDAASPLVQFADHPGVRLYLGPVWRRAAEFFDASPSIPKDPDDLRAADHALAAIGRDEIQAMWKRLGVTGRAVPGGGLWLDVTDPARAS